MRKNVANIITGCRIICSVLMIFFPVASVGFYIMYSICGISDMADGIVARKTNTANEFGAGFDSVADFIFVVAAFVKLVPVLDIPVWMWIWAGAIGAIKIVNIIAVFVSDIKLRVLHTLMNKIPGFMLFFMPVTVGFIKPQYSCLLICTAATISLIHEWSIIRNKSF